MDVWKVPDELDHPYFFRENEIHLEYPADLSELHAEELQYFPFELRYYNRNALEYPWEKPGSYVDSLFSEWTRLKESASLLFSERRKEEAAPLIRQGCALFLSALFWVNRRPVILRGLEVQLAHLNVQPLNTQERLAFILAKPNGYPAYVQLCELVSELEKKYGKLQAMRKL